MLWLIPYTIDILVICFSDNGTNVLIYLFNIWYYAHVNLNNTAVLRIIGVDYYLIILKL